MRIADPSKCERILEAAGELFAERHYHQVRMDDIAARAGVAKGTLYLHFKCKEELYIGLIREVLVRLADRIEARLADVADPGSKIRVIMQESTQYFDRLGHLVELGRRVEASSDEGGAAALQHCRERFRRLMAEVLRAFPGSDRLDDADILLGVTVLAGTLREVIMSLARPWPDDLDERLTRLFLEGFLRSLG